ncbi:hypothetical protein M231_06160 [Tremella mesenterica]|uniref:Uncharacterized protein n=1 Tax=Tremella mesenterica TaxID=5217 RepID=A0A4V1M3E1_TREME|nr:uncharacterized protein TREMEDRAFT_58350 [Tremella mesenterica DSM 1558]EIW72192.1 hypothetical protein TREMEDRAFT_58350 [Tremella mesenterica DSM 1558]RXK36550.1 hypothetical protein M231_06160 [Tremella mesenterica]
MSQGAGSSPHSHDVNTVFTRDASLGWLSSINLQVKVGSTQGLTYLVVAPREDESLTDSSMKRLQVAVLSLQAWGGLPLNSPPYQSTMQELSEAEVITAWKRTRGKLESLAQEIQTLLQSGTVFSEKNVLLELGSRILCNMTMAVYSASVAWLASVKKPQMVTVTQETSLSPSSPDAEGQFSGPAMSGTEEVRVVHPLPAKPSKHLRRRNALETGEWWVPRGLRDEFLSGLGVRRTLSRDQFEVLTTAEKSGTSVSDGQLTVGNVTTSSQSSKFQFIYY